MRTKASDLGRFPETLLSQRRLVVDEVPISVADKPDIRL
jgi:hypothetical protein